MKLWAVKQVGIVSRGEFAEVLVRAESANEALRIVLGLEMDGFLADGSNADVKEIALDGEPGVIMADRMGD